MWKHAVNKWKLEIRYVSDWYKTQGMCDKAVVENGGALKFVPDSCKKNV